MLMIKVTAEDIATGMKRNCHQCPVALAIRRAAPSIYYTQVGHSTIEMSSEARNYIGKTPDDVKAWMIAFDAGQQVNPMMFALEWL